MTKKDKKELKEIIREVVREELSKLPLQTHQQTNIIFERPVRQDPAPTRYDYIC